MNLLNGLFLGGVAAVAVYGLCVLLDHACDLDERVARDVTETMAEDYRYEARQQYNHE